MTFAASSRAQCGTIAQRVIVWMPAIAGMTERFA